MIGPADCAVDAQSLISMSLMKMHSSRTQRGGVRLHRNLLLSRVLRSARQLYVRERYAEIYRMQQYEEVMAVCEEIRELDPLDLRAEDAEDAEEQARAACHPAAALCRSASALLPLCAPLEDGDKEPEPPFYRSCCMEAAPVPPVCAPLPANSRAHCSQTTVLDLDTHVVTTVEGGLLHQDCCCEALQCGQSAGTGTGTGTGTGSPAKKRKVESGCSEEVSDFAASRKRAKREDSWVSCAELADSPSISTLISIFGSGFSGLLGRPADPEPVCSKQVLAGLGAWTRAIVAF